MSLSIVVNGGGTFTASMEEGPVSFTASLGAVPGPTGATGATGPAGVVAATAPILYDSGTQTVSISATPTFTSAGFNSPGSAVTINAERYIPFSATYDVAGMEYRGDKVVFPDDTEQNTAGVPNPTAAPADGQILAYDEDTLRPVWINNRARSLFVTARNNTGSTIPAGSVVYISGATANRPTIALAIATSEATSARTIGITSAAISNNTNGSVIVSGIVENIDTSAFSAGAVVYLSDSVAGGLRTTLPTQPLHGVVIGIVTRSHASLGSIEVTIQNYQELGELSDILIASKANNDLLAWDSTASVWKNRTFATLGLLTSATAASTYAPLSSPALTDTPTAPTAAATTNTTQIATTAFVQTSNPAASETVAGHVELATDAEAIAGSNTTTAMTPADVRRHLMSHRYRPIPIIGWSTAASGTGAAASQLSFYPSIVSANAGVAGNARLTALVGLPSRGKGVSVLNWNKPTMVTFRFEKNNVTDTEQTVILSFGKNLTWPGYGDLIAKGMAVKIVGSTISLQVHDGTNLTNVTASVSLTVSETTDFLLLSNGAGTVDLYVNDAVVATTTAGPTGDSATNRFLLSAEIDSTSSSVFRTTNYIGCVSFWHDC